MKKTLLTILVVLCLSIIVYADGETHCVPCGPNNVCCP
jgi:hypothetical protein